MGEKIQANTEGEKNKKSSLSDLRNSKSVRWAKFKRILGFVGPGIIAGASDDDPSGIASFSQAGAGFGLTMLWTPLLCFPLMTSVQQMCARIGLVSKEGLTGTVKKYYPKSVLFLVMLITFPAITLNLGADLQGMGAVAHLLFPRIPTSVFSVFFTVLIIFVIVRFPYQKLVKIFKWLCLSLLLYAIVPFMVKADVVTVLKNTFVPAIRWDKPFLNIFVASLGSIISPYMFFWQAAIEAEEVENTPGEVKVNKRLLGNLNLDVAVGMFFSCLVMYFIILTTGTVLFESGHRQIETVGQAAQALEPLAGKLSYLLFAMGIIGTGFLAVPSHAGSLSYMMAETFDWKKGLNKKFAEAPGFYLTMILSLVVSVCLDFFGINPIQALIYAAVLYGLIAPVLIGFILHMCNNQKIMGRHTNGKWENMAGFTTMILTGIASLALIYFLIF